MSAQPERLIPRLDDASLPPVYPLVRRGFDLALTSSHVIALPWIMMAVHRRRDPAMVEIELVLVGTSRDGVWRAMRVDLPFPHEIRHQPNHAQEHALRELPDTVTVCTADGHPQMVDVWVLSEGTPILGRLGLVAAAAVTDLLAPVGFNMESH